MSEVKNVTVTELIDISGLHCSFFRVGVSSERLCKEKEIQSCLTGIVSSLRAGGTRDHCSVPGWCKTFIYSSKCAEQLWNSPSLIFGTGNPFPGV